LRVFWKGGNRTFSYIVVEIENYRRKQGGEKKDFDLVRFKQTNKFLKFDVYNNSENYSSGRKLHRRMERDRKKKIDLVGFFSF
jgi:hypothetical protein